VSKVVVKYGGDTEKLAISFYVSNKMEYSKSVGVQVTEAILCPPASYINQNAPNPFNPNTEITTIPYGLDVPAHAKILVLDGVGAPVKLLVDEDKPCGDGTVDWNGKNEAGLIVANGNYPCFFWKDGGVIGAITITVTD